MISRRTTIRLIATGLLAAPSRAVGNAGRTPGPTAYPPPGDVPDVPTNLADFVPENGRTYAFHRGRTYGGELRVAGKGIRFVTLGTGATPVIENPPNLESGCILLAGAEKVEFGPIHTRGGRYGVLIDGARNCRLVGLRVEGAKRNGIDLANQASGNELVIEFSRRNGEEDAAWHWKQNKPTNLGHGIVFNDGAHDNEVRGESAERMGVSAENAEDGVQWMTHAGDGNRVRWLRLVRNLEDGADHKRGDGAIIECFVEGNRYQAIQAHATYGVLELVGNVFRKTGGGGPLVNLNRGSSAVSRDNEYHGPAGPALRIYGNNGNKKACHFTRDRFFGGGHRGNERCTIRIDAAGVDGTHTFDDCEIYRDDIGPALWLQDGAGPTVWRGGLIRNAKGPRFQDDAGQLDITGAGS